MVKNTIDTNQLGYSIVQQAIGEIPKEVIEPAKEKNPAAVALGRLGGLKGGKARAEKLTIERKKEIAKKAAQARWSRQR
jgi:hypothetical protein